MKMRIARVFPLVCLLAALIAGAAPASAQDCREHGQAVDSSMVLDAIRAARLPMTDDDGEDSAGEAEAEEPHEAEKDDGSWDVSGTFGPVKTVQFTTDEGTWVNLDVHPAGDLIVFDLLGDLYTVPMGGGEATRISEGAFYDFQPRFSPDGDKLLFTSDRDGGFNVWVADFTDGELGEPRAVTEEKKQLADGADWDPSGEWIYVRKRVTDISSIGISEAWAYHVDGGSGISLVGRDQVGEVDGFAATADGRWLYLGTRPPFRYNQDPYASIWTIQRYDRERGKTDPVSVGMGSSAVPALSPDEKTLAFVRRVDGKSTLWLHDVGSGAERQVWDGLDRDQIETFATHGVYPGYDWTPDGDALVVWAQGGLFKISPWDTPVGVERIPFEAEVEQQVHEVLRQPREPCDDTVRARIVRWPVQSPDGESLVFQALGRLYRMELPDGTPERLTQLDSFELSPAFSPDGKTLIFAAWNDEKGGTLYKMKLPDGKPKPIYEVPTQLANPAFSPDGESLVFVQGSGANLRGQDLGNELRHDLYVMPASGGEAEFVISTQNRGPNRRITRPSFGPDGERLYYFEDLPGTGGGSRGARQPEKTGLSSVKLDGTDRRVHLQFRYAQSAVPNPQLTHVVFNELHNAYVIPMPGAGKTLDVQAGSTVPVAQLSWDGGEWVGWADGGNTVTWSFGREFKRIALADLEFKAQPAPRPEDDEEEAETIELSVAADGSYGYDDETLDLDALAEALEKFEEADPKPKFEITIDDEASFGAWTALKKWLEEQEFAFSLAEPEEEGEDEDAEEGDDDGEEEDEEKVEPEIFTVELAVPRARPEGTIALVGARIITMDGDEVIEGGTVVVEDDRISAVGPRSEVTVPKRAKVIDVSGKTIIPGLVDVHAHMGYGVLDVNPQKEWRYYANLAYGVTTTHDPSASTHTVFGQSEMVEAGIMIGPRIYSTGFILYGAIIPDMATIDSYEDALSHVRRLKSLGAFSVKSYMQPRRDQRQWVIKAAREEEMLVFPEGGGDYEANMSMLLDGHTGIEHALSIGPIYRDVVELFAQTQVGYTPTLLVSYGGQFGENWFYQHYDVWEDEKLQAFYPPRLIDARARRRTMTPEEDYNHKTVAAGCNKILDAGGLVNLGAHGQLQGLGAHWEMWAMTHGGMTPLEAIRVATINGAVYIGMDEDLGSIETGKLADLVVLDKNPLEAIENSDSVVYTMINGFLYDAGSMDRVWPTRESAGDFHFQTGWSGWKKADERLAKK
jgi:imidazolonepropionase-like amidohydrolase/Tol biopolymer transport system component